MTTAYDHWTAAQKDPAYWAELAKLDFAVELNSKMEEQHLSRSDLAKKVSVSKAYISKILGGYANFTIESMSKLAFALGLKIEIFFRPASGVSESSLESFFTPSLQPDQIYWSEDALSQPNTLQNWSSNESEKVAA
jgi:transcriptional regulator with XRE-family HTH domain